MRQYPMSTVDVAAEVACLRKLVQGLFLINVYDVSGKSYLLKFATNGQDGGKLFVILDSGVRFHSTKYDRDRKNFPSNFCLKLRQHIRGKRLNDIRQLGMDRIVDFTFGHGEMSFHLILEIYAQGNIVLTDSKYEALTMLRSHHDNDKNYVLMPRHPYPVNAIRLAQPVTFEDLKEGLNNAKEGTNLKSVLAHVLPYGMASTIHCIICACLNPLQKKCEDRPFLEDYELHRLVEAVQRLEKWMKDCWTEAPEGLIYYKDAKEGKQDQDPSLLYEDFAALALKQDSARQALHFPSFDAALDEYFSKIEIEKVDAVTDKVKKNAENRFEKSKKKQEMHAAKLHKTAETAENQAAAIELNMEVVDSAIGAVNEVVASGMDWKAVENLIKEETENGNPVAGVIESLHLDKNSITLLLDDPQYLLENDEDFGASSCNPREKQKGIKVHVDLGLTAFGNASAHYSVKKQSIRKEQRTHEKADVALKASQKKAQAKSQQQRKEIQALYLVRKPHWFEKFNWFISSENYLVISGRDALQNELIVKRYMGKDDLYVHADTHGASSTIIKNHRPGHPVPPGTLQQAGVACVCRSKAWESKVVDSAWWVFAHQVSKTAPSGEYLTTGGFMVVGKRNFLPPASLVYGFGFLFKLEDGCIESHGGERAPKTSQGVLPDDDLQEQQLVEPPEPRPVGIDQDEAAQEAPQTKSVDDSPLDSFLDAPADYLSKRISVDVGTSFEKDSCEQSGEDLGRSGIKQVATPEDPESSQGASTQPEDKEKPDRKRRLSKKERATLKKGNSSMKSTDTGEICSVDDHRPDKPAEEDVVTHSNPPSVSKVPSSPSVPQPKPRPKSGKNKKSKYDDWDDEDRELVLQFLGAGGEKVTKAQRRAQRKEKQSAKRSERNSLRVGHKEGFDIHEAIARAKEVPFATAREAQVADIIEDGKEEIILEDIEEVDEQVTAKNVEEAVDEDQPGIDHDLASLLNSLTGCPRAEDTLLFALPVCAPYDVLLSYKYKVKLTPGPLKKGKAVKQARDLMTHIGGAVPQEVLLIEGAPETEMTHALLASVKIDMPGMQKIKEDKKKSKKKGKK